MATSITQHGITVTFTPDSTVGQYVNGDYYVVGAVSVTQISVGSGDHLAGSVSGLDGAMIDPLPTAGQGYDSRAPQYNASLKKVAPFGLAVGQSLICAESADPPQQYTSGNDVYLETSIVLTCVATAPPADSFRPQYCSGTKTAHQWDADCLELLPGLADVTGTPLLATVAATIERVQLDHVINWSGRQLHPYQNMPDYGRELAEGWGDALLMAMLDPADVGDITTLVQRLIQIGIDLYGIGGAGGYWEANGGHAAGRKAPILFAGHLLGDSGMTGIGTSVRFQEDRQSFYVSQADIDRGVGYDSGDLGLAEWGIRHAYLPSADSDSLTSSYRWIGRVFAPHALACAILGLDDDWGWPAVFDYVDRYRDVVHTNGGVYAMTTFHLNMHDTYWDTYYTSFSGPNMAVHTLPIGVE